MMIMPVSLQESVSDKKIIMKCILVSSLLFQDFCSNSSRLVGSSFHHSWYHAIKIGPSLEKADNI